MTLLLVALSMLVAEPVLATKVRAFRFAAGADYLAGQMDGVSIGPSGQVRLAQAIGRVASIEEPFLLSAAATTDGGAVLGTGNSGKVLHVSADGTLRELFAAEEPEVFAVFVEGSKVYAAASPEARVYRFDLGSEAPPVVVAETEEKYVWAMAREPGGGRLLVATGTNGRLLAIDEQSGERSVVFDDEDTHVRSMLVQVDSVLVGTVGEGRILRLTKDRAGLYKARTVFDAAQPEITSLVGGPAGGFYAAAVASEASLAQLEPPKNGNGDAATPPAAGTRPAGYEGARSVVLAVDQAGSVETIDSFQKETVYSLLWESDGSAESEGTLWVATGQEGKLYRRRGEELVFELDLDELQLMKLLRGPNGLSVATTNGAALYRTSVALRTEGAYLSKVLDTKFPSQFGTLHTEAALPNGTSIAYSLRTGQSAFPDDTWSEWVDVGSARGTRADVGVPVAFDVGEVPLGRYVQWRASLRRSARGDAGPELSVVELSYRQENRKPEIEQLQVREPGVVLVKGSFNPSNQVFEPTAPNRDGIFTTLDRPAQDDKARPKELWKLGYRTLQWKAEDPNKDRLEFSIAVRREGSARWLQIAEKVEKSNWGFDSTVLPDGHYRFRVSASDAPANGESTARTAEKVSGLVVIDHTPPTVTMERSGGRLTVLITDSLSPVRSIEISRNAKAWQTLSPRDGMIDGRSETIELEASDDLLLLRVVDASFNATVAELSP